MPFVTYNTPLFKKSNCSHSVVFEAKPSESIVKLSSSDLVTVIQSSESTTKSKSLESTIQSLKSTTQSKSLESTIQPLESTTKSQSSESTTQSSAYATNTIIFSNQTKEELFHTDFTQNTSNAELHTNNSNNKVNLSLFHINHNTTIISPTINLPNTTIVMNSSLLDLSQTNTSTEMNKRIIPLRKNTFGPYSKWNSFIESYKAIQNQYYNTTHVVMYQKRGTTGISGQLIGICDALFIAASTNRALRFSSNIVTDRFYNFGLSHIFINTSTSEQQLISKFSPPTYTKPYSIVIKGTEEKDIVSAPTLLSHVKGPIQLRTLHVMADRFFKRKENHALFSKMGLRGKYFSKVRFDLKELYHNVDGYYGRCIKSLFPPSDFVQQELDYYEKQLGTGLKIGVHIRMGSGFSDWNDSRAFISQDSVLKFIDRLKIFIEKQKQKHQQKHPKEELMVRIFLSTDSTTEEKLMRKHFPHMVVTTRKLKRSHVGGIHKTKYDENAVLKAVLDQMLLGKCEILFLTKKSGFSKIGLYYAQENTSFRYI